MDVNRLTRLPEGVLSVATLAGLLLAGCAELKIKPTAAPVAPPPSTAQAAPAAKVEEADKEESTLAAVEEFLDRTKQYRTGAIPADPPPSGAVVPEVPIVVTSAPKEAPRAKPVPDRTVANAQVTIDDTAPSRPTQAIPAIQTVRVRAADPPSVKSVAPAPSHATNTALDARADESAGLADRLLKSLEQQAKDKPGFDAQWRLHMVELALDRDSDPISVSTVNTENTEKTGGLLSSYFDLTRSIRNIGRDPNASTESALSAADGLREQLRLRSDPSIRAVALCRKVVTFGVYDEMTEEDFQSGRSIQTIVYSELANLHYEKTTEGLHETKLSTRLEVFNPAGDSVWQREEPEVVDRCRQPRTDFFLAQRITLPPTLPAGEYTLKVTVEDRIANRADESKVTFAINAPVSVAAKKSSTPK
jgi:hypothetical protein